MTGVQTCALPIFNSVNVEGWALYAEAEMQPYEPLDGQLFALQARAMRAARAFLDPMVNLGRMTPDGAKAFLMREVTLSEPFARSTVFPPMVVKMMAIGERSGALDSLLEKIAEFYDQQVEAEVKGLTSMIEPIMIAIMGVIVGGIVLAVFLPIFKLQDRKSTRLNSSHRT